MYGKRSEGYADKGTGQPGSTLQKTCYHGKRSITLFHPNRPLTAFLEELNKESDELLEDSAFF